MIQRFTLALSLILIIAVGVLAQIKRPMTPENVISLNPAEQPQVVQSAAARLNNRSIATTLLDD